MGAAAKFQNDGLVNVVANLGTERDKAASTAYGCPQIQDQEIYDAYRGAWLPRKIVEIPAKDATRKWRAWHADEAQIEKIEAEEKRLHLQAKTLDAMIKARLWGGAAIYFSTGEDPEQPLVTPKAIKHLTVLTRKRLTAGELDRDFDSPTFGLPMFYTVSGSMKSARIHRSRLAIFQGATLADDDDAATRAITMGWSDSILLAVMEAIKNADSTMANIASLIFEAKVDVISIPDFMNNLGDKEYEAKVLERLRLAAMAKGINGMLLLDALETYSSKSANFSTLPDIMDRFLQVVSGAADIPATRLLSQAPAGMNATGESDERNYEQMVHSKQELEVTPALAMLDQCMLTGALGSAPPKITYVWRPLRQMTEKECADIGKTTAETIKTLGETRLYPDETLQATATTMLVERGVAPGLEQAIEEYGNEVPEDEPEEPTQTQVGDAAPRTLYVSRRVENANELLAWARKQGFKSVTKAEDLHVTIAFSREKIDWMKVGAPWGQDPKGTLMIPAGGARLVEPLGDKGAVVLLFNSSELAWRHMAIREAGASWDYAEYQPHITITYQAGDLDVSKVEPYRGKIELGPEIFEEVVEDWEKNIRETA